MGSSCIKVFLQQFPKLWQKILAFSNGRDREAYLDEVQQLIQVLHLIPLCLSVVSAGVQAGALDGASVQGQIHGFRVQLYGLVAHCLVHVTVQLICGMEEKMFKPVSDDNPLMISLLTYTGCGVQLIVP